MYDYMYGIIEIFPAAADIRENGVEVFSLYLFEEELRSAFRLIVWGKTHNLNKIIINEPSEQLLEFLIEKGYKITRMKNSEEVQISWGD